MEEAGFENIGAYTLKRQNAVTQYIATWSILDTCKRIGVPQEKGRTVNPLRGKTEFLANELLR